MVRCWGGGVKVGVGYERGGVGVGKEGLNVCEPHRQLLRPNLLHNLLNIAARNRPEMPSLLL